jgi:hypothetical protein
LSLGKNGDINLILQETDRKKARIACGRFVKELEGMLGDKAVTYYTATFPEDGKTPKKLIERLEQRDL